MIRQTGVITQVADGVYRVAVQRQSACSSCHSKTQCGVSTLDGLRRQGHVELTLHTESSLQLGQPVDLGIDEAALIKAALLAYALPLMLLLLVSGSAQTAGLSTTANLLLCAVALPGGFYLARLLGRRSLQQLQPRLLDGMSGTACITSAPQS